MIDLKFSLFALTTVTAPNRVAAPISPLTLISPVPAVIVKVCAPLTVLDRVIVPAPLPVVSDAVSVKVMGLAKERFWLVVETVPARLTSPAPV